MLFLVPSRNLSFGGNIFSSLRSLAEVANAHRWEVPVDPLGRMLVRKRLVTTGFCEHGGATAARSSGVLT